MLSSLDQNVARYNFNPGFNLLGIVDACYAVDNPGEKALWGFVPENFWHL